jgi:hypothetical protein
MDLYQSGTVKKYSVLKNVYTLQMLITHIEIEIRVTVFCSDMLE